MNPDLYLFNIINGYAKKSRTLDLFAIFCAEYLGYVLVIILAGMAFVTGNWQIFLIPILVGLFSRFIINETVYMFYKRKRPLEVLPIIALIKKPGHSALPSGHASFFFALSFALLFFHFPLAVIFIIVSFFVCLARVFCGVHWPADILAGAAAAGITVLLFQPLT